MIGMKAISIILVLVLASMSVLAVGPGAENQTGEPGEAKAVNQEAKVINQEIKELKAGTYAMEGGEQLKVQEQTKEMTQLQSGEMVAHTNMQLNQEQQDGKTKLSVQLSNGKNAEVKVMPDAASEQAMQQLKLNVCSEENACQIELKEVGKGEQTKAVYEVQAQKQAKVLGLFKAQMKVQAQIDAETGEMIKTKKSWWAFLASEK